MWYTKGHECKLSLSKECYQSVVSGLDIPWKMDATKCKTCLETYWSNLVLMPLYFLIMRDSLVKHPHCIIIAKCRKPFTPNHVPWPWPITSYKYVAIRLYSLYPIPLRQCTYPTLQYVSNTPTPMYILDSRVCIQYPNPYVHIKL